jgi:ABC-type transport system substrate-binding protein
MSSPRQTSLFWLPRLSVVLCMALAAGLCGLAASAQDPSKKPAEEKEDAPKSKTKDKDEEYDPLPAKSNKTIRVDDEEPVKGTSARPVAAPLPDVKTAARQTKHPVLSELYQGLSFPHDEVYRRSLNKDRVEFVEPLPRYYPGTKPDFKGQLSIKKLDQNGKPIKDNEGGLANTSVDSIQPYEQIALDRVNLFLKSKFDDPADKRYLTHPQMLQAAEIVLSSVLNFHESARASGVRQGDAWDDLVKALRAKLLEVHLGQLNNFIQTADWESAYALAARLADTYSKPSEQSQFAQPLLRLAEDECKKDPTSDEVDSARQQINEKKLLDVKPEIYAQEIKLQTAQQRLRRVESIFPHSSSKSSLAILLEKRSHELFNEASALSKEKSQHALQLLDRADKIWSELSDLQNERLRVNNAYPILRVGVRELPVLMAPGLARTDTERMAVELMFEGLLRTTFDAAAGLGYEPALAAGQPRDVALGRQFELLDKLYWSNGVELDNRDVHYTVRDLRKSGKWPGVPHAWDDLLADVTTGGDSRYVTLTLSRGYADPLSLMTFKILPKDLAAAEATDFAGKPIGSGPFRLKATNKSEVIFEANPYFSRRLRPDGKPIAEGLPHIREIHFLQLDQPVEDFKNGKIDLLVDPPRKLLADLRKVGASVSNPMPNQRIYFLAVNNRNRHAHLDSAALRRALTYAIDREAILDQVFRGELGKKVDRALQGPFPPGSWPCAPNAGPLFNPEGARTAMKQFEGPKEIELTLIYDQNDPQAEEAMTLLAKQVAEASIGVTLKLDKKDGKKLHDLVLSHNYELAYFHYDYDSLNYWLGPLFDPAAMQSGGNNYLGFIETNWLGHLNDAMNRRNFVEIQAQTRLMDGIFAEQMPFIPLWQLDRIIAYSPSLKPVPLLDPLYVFPGVEHWLLEASTHTLK